MTKQELAHIAKVMYDLQKYCSFYSCQHCPMSDDLGFCSTGTRHIPRFWGITKADIERLEREGK